MNKNNLIQATSEQGIIKDTIKGIHKKISETSSDGANTSKEKYLAKVKLIEEANDISTQEKLNAMDSNYDCWNKEHWQNMFYYTFVSFSMLGVTIGSYVAVKSVRKLLTAA